MSLSRSLIFRFLFAEFDLEKKSALTGICWGLRVIVSQSFDSSPAFRYLVATGKWFPLGAEAFWGGLIATAGFLQLWGLARGRRGPRMGAALFSCTVWLSVMVAFLLHNPRGPSLVIYGLLAYANAALYYQVGTARRS